MPDEMVHRRIAVAGELLQYPVRHNGIQAQALVPHESAQSVYGRSLHFEIGNPVAPVFEIGQLPDQSGVAHGQTQHSPLWPVKSGTSNSNAAVISFFEMFQQRLTTGKNVGTDMIFMDAGMPFKSAGHPVFGCLLRIVVIEHEIVQTQSVCAGNHAVHRDIGLKGPRCTETKKVQGSQFGFDLTVCEINVDEGVEFVEGDVDIVGADTGGQNAYSFAADIACMGIELAVMEAELNPVEVATDSFHPVGIAHQYDRMGYFFGTDVQMIDRTPAIDDELRFGNSGHDQ